MTKAINLFSLISISDEKLIQSYLNLLSIKFQPLEIETINSLCSELTNNGCEVPDCNDFYIGFEIPQISKEFDLLRMGKEKIINIELKSIFTDEQKIIYQLKRNKYYLKFLEKDISLYTYCARERKLFSLDENENLYEVEFSKLIDDLRTQKDVFNGNIAELFNPSDYLVSPFNSTDKFLNAEYFLTSHQETITNEILAKLEHKYLLVSLKGKAGTGKSLLLYHIARKLREMQKNVLIIHCGILNAGQFKLKEFGWNIMPIKEISTLENNSNLSAILVDESQRLNHEQFEQIMKYAKKQKALCVFSHDDRQTFCSSQIHSQISDYLYTKADLKFKLTDKIRTNKTINDFIYAILGKSKNRIALSENANIVYFVDSNMASNYINSRNGWTYITNTFDFETDELESHTIRVGGAYSSIGQEFDNVIAVIDNSFYYDESGELQSLPLQNSHYNRLNMFVQVITRVRQRLEIVVVGNEEVYKKMLSFFE